MKVLLVHNRYQQPGGEDLSTVAEGRILRTSGNQVVEYNRHNDEIATSGLWGKLTLGPRTVWAWDSYREVKTMLRHEKPDVAHFHNTFPLISPAPYYACRAAGVPVVQTLHNYRQLCPAATFRKNGNLCEKCVTGGLSHSVLHGCYRDSRAATAATAMMLGAHRWLGTWNDAVSCYVALTEFSRRKFIEGGLPAEKICIKPNFLSPDPLPSGCGEGGPADASKVAGSQGPLLHSGYALYVGRLAHEKGVRTMLRAWQKANMPLRIMGDGPLRQELEDFAASHGLSGVSFHGHMTPDQLMPAIKGARVLVFPSEWYETFGRVAIEAFACGVPVIASRLGAMQEIVEDGRTGLHFTAGDADDLAAKVEWARTHPEEMQVMGRAARAEFETKYTAERNYQMLMRIYNRVLPSPASA